MNKYLPDTYLLSSQFQLIAKGWDSFVFLDKNDPSVILKLYDPLTYEQVTQYYNIQKNISQRSGVIIEDDLEISVVDPTDSDKFSISQNEDGILVVLPRVAGVNLGEYGSDIQRSRILNRIKFLMKTKDLPIYGGFEIKPENIMVSDRQGGKRLVLSITDVGARVDECIKQYVK